MSTKDMKILSDLMTLTEKMEYYIDESHVNRMTLKIGSSHYHDSIYYWTAYYNKPTNHEEHGSEKTYEAVKEIFIFKFSDNLKKLIHVQEELNILVTEMCKFEENNHEI